MLFVWIWSLLICCLPFLTIQAKFVYNGTKDVEDKTLVQTKLGSITGVIVNRFGVNVSAYLSVPYAEPPVGNLRFANSTLIKPWKPAVLKAVRQAPICFQPKFDNFNPKDFIIVRTMGEEDPQVFDYYSTAKSEDCLYLSIFTQTPLDSKLKSRAGNKTVLVWIHGGGFISGTPSIPFYDYPSMVAQDPNLILVSIGYRLNLFGFLNSGTDDISGNFGLYDQIVALQWIQENIHFFGGDPNKVVLWGQSAGAISVGYHMMTNKSGNSLFRRAICESGDPLLPLSIAEPTYRMNVFLTFLGHLQCHVPPSSMNSTSEKEKWIKANLQQILKCLRAKSTEEIFAIYQNKIARQYVLAFMPNPHDASLFDFKSFWSGVHSKKYSFDGELLIGTNEMEGAQYVNIGPLNKFYHRHSIDSNFTRSNVIQTLMKVLPPNSTVSSMVEPVVDFAMEGGKNVTNTTELWLKYVQLIGDGVFVCPDYFFIKSYSRNRFHEDENIHFTPNGTHPKVFYYRFKPFISQPYDCPSWSPGSCHSDELEFIFGVPQFLNKLYPDEERKLSAKIMSTWLRFAHYGNFTNDPRSPQFIWEPYTTEDPQYLEIEMTGAEMRYGFPGKRCEDLFETLYETIETIDLSQFSMIQM